MINLLVSRKRTLISKRVTQIYPSFLQFRTFPTVSWLKTKRKKEDFSSDVWLKSGNDLHDGRWQGHRLPLVTKSGSFFSVERQTLSSSINGAALCKPIESQLNTSRRIGISLILGPLRSPQCTGSPDAGTREAREKKLGPGSCSCVFSALDSVVWLVCPCVFSFTHNLMGVVRQNFGVGLRKCFWGKGCSFGGASGSFCSGD